MDEVTHLILLTRLSLTIFVYFEQSRPVIRLHAHEAGDFVGQMLAKTRRHLLDQAAHGRGFVVSGLGFRPVGEKLLQDGLEGMVLVNISFEKIGLLHHSFKLREHLLFFQSVVVGYPSGPAAEED